MLRLRAAQLETSMTATACIVFSKDDVVIPANEQYREFCKEFSIFINSDAGGGGVVDVVGQVDDVVCHFWYGSLMFVAPDEGSVGLAAKLTKKAWCRWGGAVTADKPIRRAMVCKKVTT
jgi:hypothetical protein